jgi:hypothetical protein
MTNLSSYKQYYYPTAATAEAWDIKPGKTAYLPAGKVTGTGYFPAMMEFDGSTGYYSKTGLTFAGNKFTVICRFILPTYSSDSGSDRIIGVQGGGGFRGLLITYGDTYATTTRRRKLSLLAQTSAGATICRIFSSSNIDDGLPHTVFAEFDADAGTAVLRIDGVDEIDTGNAEHTLGTTGTLVTSAATAEVGRSTSDYWPGQISFLGWRDVGGLTWSDFMQTDGTPKQLDESTWTEWGAQPLFWNPHGDMVNNLGSGGVMTKNGTINVSIP